MEVTTVAAARAATIAVATVADTIEEALKAPWPAMKYGVRQSRPRVAITALRRGECTKTYSPSPAATAGKISRRHRVVIGWVINPGSLRRGRYAFERCTGKGNPTLFAIQLARARHITDSSLATSAR